MYQKLINQIVVRRVYLGKKKKGSKRKTSASHSFSHFAFRNGLNTMTWCSNKTRLDRRTEGRESWQADRNVNVDVFMSLHMQFCAPQGHWNIIATSALYEVPTSFAVLQNAIALRLCCYWMKRWLGAGNEYAYLNKDVVFLLLSLWSDFASNETLWESITRWLFDITWCLSWTQQDTSKTKTYTQV